MVEWDPIAPYYDILFEDRVNDIAFWVTLAKRFKSPILEFACGTGRLTIPMASAGSHIVGIDISEPMLRQAKKKILKLPTSIRKNINFIEGDVMSFSLPNRVFGAIFSPWGFLPITEKDRRMMMESVVQHLELGGYFVVDVENISEPTEDWNYSKIREYKTVPKTGQTLLRQAFNSGSKETRIGRILFTLDVIAKNGSLKRFVTERSFRWYIPSDIISLLKEYDFDIETVYGDYDFSGFSSASKLAIIVAKKKESPRSTFFSSLKEATRKFR